MAVQGIWSGTISFSLVAIPVRLVAAVKPGRVSFHLLHSKDNARLSRTMVCPEDGATVPSDEIIRGFEIGPGTYVLMTDEELDSVSPERSRTIEIMEFVDARVVDQIYFDHPYYLVPAKGGEKAYQLLVEVMHRTNKAGIAKFVLAEREYLVALMGRDNALQLMTLHYDDEILPHEDIAPRKVTVDSEEQQRMAKEIRSMTTGFEPGKYANERRAKIMDLVMQKAKGQGTVEPPALPEEEEGPADLVAALEESMRKMKAG